MLGELEQRGTPPPPKCIQGANAWGWSPLGSLGRGCMEIGGGEGAQFWGSWGKTPPEAAVYRRGAEDVPPSREVAAGGHPRVL